MATAYPLGQGPDINQDMTQGPPEQFQMPQEPEQYKALVQQDPEVKKQGKAGWLNFMGHLRENPEKLSLLLGLGSQMAIGAGQGKNGAQIVGESAQAGAKGYYDSLARQGAAQQQALDNEFRQVKFDTTTDQRQQRIDQGDQRIEQGDKQLEQSAEQARRQAEMAERKLGLQESKLGLQQKQMGVDAGLKAAQAELTRAKTKALQETGSQAAEAPAAVQAARAYAQAKLGMGEYADSENPEAQAYSEAVEFLEGSQGKSRQDFQADIIGGLMPGVQLKMMTGELEGAEAAKAIQTLDGFSRQLADKVYGGQDSNARQSQRPAGNPTRSQPQAQAPDGVEVPQAVQAAAPEGSMVGAKTPEGWQVFSEDGELLGHIKE